MKSDELVVQFKVDDAELKKGYQELDRSNDKMERSLEDIEKKAEVTADKLFELGKKVVGFIAAAVVANQTIGQAIEEAREVTRLDSFSNAISSSIEDVNALNNSIISLGGDKETAEANTQAIFDAISEGARDSESEFAKSFKKIGVSIKDTNGEARDLFETMGDLSESISRMDDRKAKEFMKSLGITDRATLELMMKGRAEFEQMIKVQKEASPINEESTRKSVEFTKALNRLQLEFSKLKTSALTTIMPALTWLMEKFEFLVGWMNRNKPFIVAFFGSIAAVITATYLPAIAKAVLATAALLAPYLALIAALAVFALAIDDATRYLQGHDSVLGRTIATVRELSPAYAEASDAFSQWISDFAQSNDKIGMIKRLFSDIGDWAKNASKEIAEDVTGIFKSIANSMIDSIKQSFKDLIDLIKSVIRDFEDSWAKAKDFFGIDGGGNYQALLDSRADTSEKARKEQEEKNIDTMYHATYSSVPKISGGNQEPSISKEEYKESLKKGAEMSMINPESLKQIAIPAAQAIQGANLMPDIKSIAQEATHNISRSTTNTSNVNIDKVEVIAQSSDPNELAKNINEAFEKAFANKLNDLQSEDATGRLA